MKRLAIIGLGLMGGSLGLALKAAGGYLVSGYARRPEVAARALERGAIAAACPDLAAAAQADIIVVATPTLAVAEVFRGLGPHLAPGRIVTDMASTKEQVGRWAEELLPEGVDFVGGHPMAGKETAGIASAEARLFRGCTYCLVPSPRARPQAIAALVELVERLEAHPIFLGAARHDYLAAGVSHLPFLLAAALMTAAAADPAWDQMAPLAATGFRSATRLASGDPTMNGDICQTNQAHILHWLDRYIEELKDYRRLVAETGIEEALARAQKLRGQWLEQRWGQPAAGGPGGDHD